MATEDTLLREIWEAPEDHDRLAVYADWLIENGDATRGEYMQLALLDKPTPAQEKRQEALRKKHRGAWLGGARKFVWTWEESETSPGFLSRVSCNVGNLAKGIDELIDLGPRLLVSLKPVKTAADRKKLAGIPLGDLYGLGLYETDLFWINDRLIEGIVEALDGIVQLEISAFEGALSLNAWRKILAIPSLRELRFHGGSDAFLAELLQANALTVVRISEPDNPVLQRQLAKAFKGRYIQFGGS